MLFFCFCGLLQHKLKSKKGEKEGEAWNASVLVYIASSDLDYSNRIISLYSHIRGLDQTIL